MKNKGNHIKLVVVLILFLCMGICFWLPSKLFAMGDRQKMGELQRQETEKIVVESYNQVSLEEKFKLIYDRQDDLRMISVESKPEERSRMWEKLREEISLLKKNKGLPQSLDLESKKQSCQRYFFMDAKKPEVSMYLWIWYIGDERQEVSLGVEEESGKILIFDLHKFLKRLNEKKIIDGFTAYLQPEITYYQTPETYYYSCYDKGYSIYTGILGYQHFKSVSSGYSTGLYDEMLGISSSNK